MKKSRFTETQIVKALKEHESGRSTEDICRELDINKATFYNWRKKYGGMESNELKRLKELEEENRKLKAMYADLVCWRERLLINESNKLTLILN